MGFLDWLRRHNVTPSEQRAVSPTAAAYMVTTGIIGGGFYRKDGISFDKAAKEGYGKNVIAYCAVDEVAKAIASAPWLAYQRTALDRDEVPVPQVFVRPNPYQSWADFIYGAVSYLQIAGEVPIEAIVPGDSLMLPPTRLYLHIPDTVRPIPGRDGLSSYAIMTQGGQFVPRWLVDPVTGQSNMRIIKTFNPCDPWRGLSPISAAALSIDVHNDANVWNANLLRKGASSDLLVTSKTPMADASFARLQELFKKDMSGAQNVKAVTLIDGLGADFHIEKISFSPRDMSWIEAKNTSAHEVAIAIGGSTMPFLLGLSGTMTYSNQKEARQAFWDTFIIPLIHRFRDELNVWLMSRFGEGLELDVDLDEVSALEPRRESKWDRLEKSTFLSINEKREALGYDPITEPGADVPVGLLQYALASQTTEPEEEEDETEKKAAAFERDLVAGGVSVDVAKGLRQVTFLNGTPKEGASKNGVLH